MNNAPRTTGLTVALIALTVAFVPIGRSSAAAGDLDKSFGEGGVATFNLEGFERGQALALQADGKIVVTGHGPGRELTVLRFNPDGSIDTTFSDDGVFITDRISDGADVFLMGDGKIVAGGRGDAHLVRLNADGTTDNGFGQMNDGFTGSQFFNPDDPDETYPLELNRAMPWDGGRVIVAGGIDYGPYFFTLARYSSDGFIDTAFGDDGQVQDDFSPPDDHLDQEPYALARYDQNRFVAGGYREVHDDEPEAAVIAMYNADGSRDKSFGDDGKTTTNMFPDGDGSTGDEAIQELFPLADGRILAIGDGEMLAADGLGVKRVPFMMMFDEDGTLSTSFGNNGTVVYEIGEDSRDVRAAGLAPDGKIVIAGDDATAGHVPYVARFAPDGTPDPNFGENGWMRVDSGVARVDFEDLAVDARGDIYLTGLYDLGADANTAVFKIKGSSGTQRTFGDINCNGTADSVDALGVQRNLAALPVNQTQPCPAIGDIVDIQAASQHPWGDVDCDNDVDTVDSLKLLRFVAALPVQSEPGCPGIGSAVLVTKLGRR